MTNQILSILNDAQKLREVVKASFDNADTNESGYIDTSELETLMKKVASDAGFPPPKENHVKDVLKELDMNNDGKISLDEYAVLIKQILEVMATQ